VNIYDQRGEKVMTLCGSIVFSGGIQFSMSLSDFTPDPSGLGGQITIFLNGQAITNWDAKDQKGNWVPNSFYHFVMEEHSTDGNRVLLERDAYIAPYRGQAVLLTAWPNVAASGGSILFTASFAGTPANDQSRIKVYAVSGELVKTLTPSLPSGTVSWNLDDFEGRGVASGLYVVALDGIDWTNGRKLQKVVKVMITH
jgi:hypothetical protein